MSKHRETEFSGNKPVVLALNVGSSKRYIRTSASQKEWDHFEEGICLALW